MIHFRSRNWKKLHRVEGFTLCMPYEQWVCVCDCSKGEKSYRWWDALINCTDVCLDAHKHTSPSHFLWKICVRHSRVLHLLTTNNYDDAGVLRLLASHPHIVTSFRIAVAVFVISSVLSTSVNPLVVMWRRLRVWWRRWWGWRIHEWWL